MDKKKILIICKAFYPENSPRSFRATELAKEFARQGHDVTVFTNQRDFDYSEFLGKHNIKLKNYGRLIFKKIQLPYLNYVSHKFNRLLYMFFDYPNIEIMWRLKKALKHERGYDLMISIAVPYPVHWGIAWARKKNTPIANTWIADCGDPFMGNKLESFKYPFYFAFLEKWFSRKAEYITIPFQDLIGCFYKEFHAKIRIIPQGFNFDEIQIIRKEINSTKPIFAYAGGVAKRGVRNIFHFIEYLLRLEVDFEFHVFPRTGRNFLKPYIQKSKGKIILHEPLSRDELLPILSKMDFLVNLILESSITKQMPSKLIDYALTGRPILNINLEKPQKELIEEFLKKNYQRAYKIENIEQYNIKNVAIQFLKLH